MKVSEVMTKKVLSLNPEDVVEKALNLLFKIKISGLPVIEHGKIVGMFTEKEFIARILPGYLERVGRFVYEENPKIIKQKISKLINLKVKDLMRKEVITINEDTTLCEAVRIMLTQKIRRLPVIDKENKVKGIVSREDVLKGLLR